MLPGRSSRPWQSPGGDRFRIYMQEKFRGAGCATLRTLSGLLFSNSSSLATSHHSSSSLSDIRWYRQLLGGAETFPKWECFLLCPLSSSSRGVRSSDYVRCKALNVICKKNTKVWKDIFSRKSYSSITRTANRKIHPRQQTTENCEMLVFLLILLVQ